MSSVFSSKSTYTFFLRLARPIETLSRGRSMDWKVNCPPKIKTLLCLAQHNRLPTSYNLSKMVIPISPNCPICNHHIEDIIHIFFECPIIYDFWAFIFSKWFKVNGFGLANLYLLNWADTLNSRILTTVISSTSTTFFLQSLGNMKK